MPSILAIDDKKDNLVTLSALLRNLMPDCTVVTAQSGMEGIGKARAELPDTILLDIKMPDMDGFETCRRLKADESTKHIPVIMITAIKTDPQSRIKGLEIGADAFIAKPIDEYELVSQVKVALRIKKAEDALREKRDSLEKTVQERTSALREEIAFRRQAEEQIRFSLREKEVLLQEIQHRVKNNLLTISGVLALQLNRIKDDESKDAFITSMNRINAMTRIHTRLYQSEDFSRIGVKGYIEELLWELSRSYGFPYENIITNIEDISIDINTAIPAGLIVNELVSNAMKHAFQRTEDRSQKSEDRGQGAEGAKGSSEPLEPSEITITLKENRGQGVKGPSEPLEPSNPRTLEPSEKQITLSVSDNGIGLPPHIDFRNTESIGLSLLVQLVDQINGSIELIRDNGTGFIITISIDQEKMP